MPGQASSDLVGRAVPLRLYGDGAEVMSSLARSNPMPPQDLSL